MPDPKKIALVHVAERAGVSTASVSRVLNGRPASDQVTERVREAASALGYVPSATARSLKAGRTDQISLAVADVGNPVYVAMMHEVSRVVTDAGYRLVLSSTGNDPQDQLDLLDSMGRGFVDGLIISPLRMTPELVEKLAGMRLPVVVIGILPEGVQVDNVRADSRKGMSLAIKHLVEQQRRRIAFLNGPVDTVPGAARLAGYLRAMERRGQSWTADTQVSAVDFTFRAGLDAARTLLDQSTPDAVVCANDLIAVAAIKVAAERGIRVPEDLAIVGMDDTDIAEISSPSITSVDLGGVRRASAAAALLLRRLEDPTVPVEQVVIKPRLVVRESSVRRDTGGSPARQRPTGTRGSIR